MTLNGFRSPALLHILLFFSASCLVERVSIGRRLNFLQGSLDNPNRWCRNKICVLEHANCEIWRYGCSTRNMINLWILNLLSKTISCFKIIIIIHNIKENELLKSAKNKNAEIMIGQLTVLCRLVLPRYIPLRVEG